MAKPKLGNKHQCLSCGAKFYDLGKTEIVCPKCGTPFVQEVVVTKAAPAPKVEKPKPKEDIVVTPVVGDVDVEIVSLEEAEVQDEDLAALKDVDVEADDDAEVKTEDDNTFLETDDDGDPNVTDLIGGGIAKGDES